MELRAAVGRASFAIALLVGVHCQAQQASSVTITFDGPPSQPPGSAYGRDEYVEGGMWFIQHSGFTRVGAESSGYANNGTAFLMSGNPLVPLVTGCYDSRTPLFNLVSLQLAENSVNYPEPVTVHLVGYRADGTTVTADRTTDGIMDGPGPLPDFETFYFDGFTGLGWLEMLGDRFSLDNMVVVIPEPTSATLVLLGGILASAAKSNRRRRRQ